MRRAMILVAVMLAAMTLTACGGRGKTAKDLCDKPEEYQKARSVPDLVTPPGLDEPDTSTRLVIPDEDKAGDYPQGRPCLDRPPDYFGR